MEGPDTTPRNGHRHDQESDGAVLTAPRPAAPSPTPTPPPRERWRRSTRIGLAVIATVSLLEGAAFGGTYYFDTSKYVSTDNAQVDGDKVDINAPATGTVTEWTVTDGSTVHKNQVLGRIKGIGAGGQAQHPIKSPGNGTVAVNNAVNGEDVNAGTELATAFNFNDIYVTARVAETDIKDVHVGQPVGITIDASPKTPVTGIVEEIQNSSAGSFSFFPGPDTDPSNPQKVDQYIPVKIEFTNTDGLTPIPGTNVTVHIHKP
jgi:multidrug resistance efflux pump